MGHDITVGKELIPRTIFKEDPENYDPRTDRYWYCTPGDCFDVNELAHIGFGAGNQLADEFYAMLHLSSCHDGCSGDGIIVYIPRADFLENAKRCTEERLKMIEDDGRIKNFIEKLDELYKEHDYLYWYFG